MTSEKRRNREIRAERLAFDQERTSGSSRTESHRGAEEQGTQAAGVLPVAPIEPTIRSGIRQQRPSIDCTYRHNGQSTVSRRRSVRNAHRSRLHDCGRDPKEVLPSTQRQVYCPTQELLWNFPAERAMKIRLLLCLLALAVATPTAQTRLNISRDRLCSWNDDLPIPEVLYNFPADANTTSAVANIMKHTGLQVNFELVAANVPNALATMEGTRRLILYNQLFMRDMATKSGTDWAALSVLAHEIGHHLNQHTLGSGGGRDEQELAADKFSGDVLFKMGATLEQARAAMASRPETKSPNYPPKSVRLVAIGNGWIGAQETAGKTATRAEDTAKQTQADRERREAAERQAELDRERAAREQERLDRQRKADEERTAREEREERAREREEREARAREREEARRAASRGCYDGFGRRWCSLPNNTPLGSACFCYGVPGSGITGNP